MTILTRCHYHVDYKRVEGRVVIYDESPFMMKIVFVMEQSYGDRNIWPLFSYYDYVAPTERSSNILDS